MKPRGLLRLCGLGTDPGRDTTLETIMALEGSAEVWTDVEEPAALRWLAGRCRRLRRARAVSAILRGARGRQAAVAVWGHPLFSSRLGREVLRRAARAGLAVQVVGAVSPVAAAFARTVWFLGGDYGYQAIQSYELEALLGDPGILDVRLPLVVCSDAPRPGRWAALLELLGRRYPAGHPFHLDAPGARDAGPRPLGELPEPSEGWAVLWTPPL